MNTNDGGTAFPCAYHRDGNSADTTGMSLRDWFAGQALAGLLGHDESNTTEAGAFARDAYALADAMLRARETGR